MKCLVWDISLANFAIAKIKQTYIRYPGHFHWLKCELEENEWGVYIEARIVLNQEHDENILRV